MHKHVALLVAIPLVWACGGEVSGGTRCRPGETKPCTCLAGLTGSSTCGDNGSFAPCDCSMNPLLELGGTADPTGETDRRIDFGSVAKGATAEASIPVRNAGGGDLHLSLTAVPRPFTVVESELSLPAGGEGLLAFRFAPFLDGEARAKVTVTSNGGEATIRLVGVGVEAAASCSPSSLELGVVLVGEPTPFTIACENLASAPWAAEARAAGADADAISLSLDDPLPDDDGTWTITGTVTPTHAGPIAAQIVLGAGATTVVTVPVTGEATNDALEIPEAIDLGFVLPQTRRTFEIELRNHGPVAARVNGASLAQGTPVTFGLEASGPFDIPAASGGRPGVASVIVAVAPRIQDAGVNFRGTLLLEIAGEPNPREVALTVFIGGPVLSCAPEALAFGEVATGVPTTFPLVCTNVGIDHPNRDDDALLVANVEATGDAFTPTPRGGLRPEGYRVGESFVVDVTVSPEDEASLGGTIRITSNAVGTPVLEVPVSATAVELDDCQFEVVPPMLAFGAVAKGREAVLEFAIRNRGADRCQVRDLRLESCDGPFELVEGPIASRMIGPGDELRVPVRFAPTDAHGPWFCKVEFGVSNRSDGRSPVTVIGDARAICLDVTPTSVDFGTGVPTCWVPSQRVKVRNTCVGSVELVAAEPADNSAEFEIVSGPALPVMLGLGDTAEFTLAYRPNGLGRKHGGFWFRTADAEAPPLLLPVVGTAVGDPARTDVFEQVGGPAIDVLFVIDDGAALAEQRSFAGQASALLSTARNRGVDFQLGVTAASMTGSNRCTPDGGPVGGRLLPLDGSRPRILRPGTADLESLLEANLNVGYCTPLGPELLEAAIAALTPPLVETCDDPRYPAAGDGNCGFLRENAHLSVVTLSTSSDWSARDAAYYAARLQEIKGAHRVDFHSLDHDPDAHTDLVALVGGSVHGYAGVSDWEPLATEISREVFTFPSCYNLHGPPSAGDDGVRDAADLAVTVNGQPVAPTDGGRTVWRYVEDPPAICFEPNAYPGAGARIEVAYRQACAP
jgi:hypothetical protein